MTQDTPTIRPDNEAQELVDWLVRQGLEGAAQEQILSGYCSQLLSAGLPIMRVHVAQSTFHPKYGGMGFDWLRDGGVSRETYGFTRDPNPRWLKSPLYHLLESGRGEMRERLAEMTTPCRFPMLDELKANGGTDYFAAALAFARRETLAEIDPTDVPEGVLISWTCDGPDGFADRQLALIRWTLPALGVALKSASNRRIAQDLMQVYLGRDAGNRVLSGEIQRGSLQTIEAAICYFDLVGFTALAERIPGPAVIEMLNAYFGLAVEVIERSGGHVLKFMGDGLMAMFDIGDARSDAWAALDTACELSRGMAALNAERDAAGLPVAGFTLALHDGQILYGNIGAETRLDFTVIGPTVNLAARLSDMHKAIGHDILVSENVRRSAGEDRRDLVSVGRYMLRSASEPMEVFTLFAAGG